MLKVGCGVGLGRDEEGFGRRGFARVEVIDEEEEIRQNIDLTRIGNHNCKKISQLGLFNSIFFLVAQCFY